MELQSSTRRQVSNRRFVRFSFVLSGQINLSHKHSEIIAAPYRLVLNRSKENFLFLSMFHERKMISNFHKQFFLCLADCSIDEWGN